MIFCMMKQNSMLPEEVAALRVKVEKSTGSGSSPWSGSSPCSAAGGSGGGSMSDSHRLDGHGRNGSTTSRSAVREVAASPEKLAKLDSVIDSHRMGTVFLKYHPHRISLRPAF